MNISRQTFVITIITAITLIVFGGFLFWYFYSGTTNTPGATEGGTVSNNLFPFGSGVSTPPQTAVGSSATQTPAVVTTTIRTAPTIRQITNEPVAGFTVINTATTSFVRYMERATGRIYEASLDTTASGRLSNTIIPKTVEASWLPDNQTIIARSYNDITNAITTFSGALTKQASSSEPALRGLFLPDNMKEIAIGGAKDSLFYLNETSAGSEGYIITKDGVKNRFVFASPIREWLASWPTQNVVFLTTKPSAFSEGLSYRLDLTTGLTSRLLGNLRGLITLPNQKGDSLLYSVNDNNITRLYAKPPTGSSIELPVGTLADKCAWNGAEKNQVICGAPIIFPSGSYPDLWYQGLAHFDDDLWQLDTLSGRAVLITELGKSTGSAIDVTHPTIDATGNYIVFQNKSDLTLWAVRLKEKTASTTQTKR